MKTESNIPFCFSILMFIGTVYPAMNGMNKVAGTMLILSGVVAIFWSESIADTHEKIFKKLPFNTILEKVFGKTKSSTLKLWGAGVTLVGVSWAFVL